MALHSLALSAPNHDVKVVGLVAPAAISLSPACVARNAKSANCVATRQFFQVRVRGQVPADDHAVDVHGIALESSGHGCGPSVTTSSRDTNDRRYPDAGE